MTTKHGTLLGGSLLVAGTSIGGGMLALPVLTSLGGFVPSLAIYFFCWLFMASTGLLLLELSLTYGEGVNLVTMAERTLGFPGKVIAWVLYLFLFYCLTIAYIVGCGNLVSEFLFPSLPDFIGPLLFTMVFAPFVWAGTKLVSPLNVVLMAAMGVLYLVFVILGWPHVDTTLLARRDWGYSLIALPIAFTSFAYQGIIPTLSSYMGFNARNIRLAILFGSFIPLITYVIWQWLILGIIPVEGPHGLKEALDNGYNAVFQLKHFLENPWIYIIGQYFAFVALLTSFFGVTLGLLDFLIDGFKVKQTQISRFWLSLMIFIPPLLIALYNPHIFLVALEYAGGYGCALLLGLLPILMVISKRYYQNDLQQIQLSGGKPFLACLTLFVLFELFLI